MSSQELSLPGVDLDDARQRLVDDVPFLLSLLREFVRHSIGIERALRLDGTRESLDDDLKGLHQLRGGAGNLAVQSVAGVSARMELLLKTHAEKGRPDTSVEKSLLELRTKLKTDLYALRDALRTASLDIVKEAPLPPAPRSTSTWQAPAPYTSRILIIDDSAAMRSYLKATLEKYDEPLDIVEAPDGLKGFQRLTEDLPDLVLCDLQMPEFDGLKLLSMCKGRPELREIPVLMITAEHEAEKKAEILERGAADYITKPFHSRELLARVKVHLGVRRLREEIRHVRVLLEDATTIDDLTGVYNRRHFENALLEETQRTTRYSVPLALIVLQLDHFHEFAKQNGTEMADRLLSDTGHFLSDTIRTTDKVARIAIDKFAVLLPHTGRRGANEMANRLCRSLREASNRGLSEQQHVPASFGVVSSEGTPITAKEMLGRADAAQREASRAEGGRVVDWSPLLPAYAPAPRS